MSNRTVLCHLQDWQSITVEQCRSLQGRTHPKECSGCDASSRLCATCRRSRPVCPELDLCKKCLDQALGQAGLPSKDALAAVYEWQVCVECRQRVTRYTAYGLCLHCAAKVFAGIVPPVSGQTSPPLPEPSGNGHASTLQTPEAEFVFPTGDDFTRLVSRLSDIEQIIVTLHHRDEYQMERIGEVLELSGDTVSRIYSEALQKIKDHERL